ncbi:hypothetical protein LINGRAHAP2_LOCUS216 [Linum grandiflorum]
MEETVGVREAPPAEIPIPSVDPSPISDASAAAAVPPPFPTVHQPPAAPPPPPSFYANSRKRGLETDSRTRSGNYLKLRAVVREIRPHLLEVIRTADFRSCKGAHEIRERLKVVMELCKQLTAENGRNTKSRFAAVGENGVETIVGASAFGWNFITYPDSGGEPVYYGRTKELFRAAASLSLRTSGV